MRYMLPAGVSDRRGPEKTGRPAVIRMTWLRAFLLHTVSYDVYGKYRRKNGKVK